MAERLIDRKALRKDIEERICKNCGVRNEPLACHFCKAGRVISRVENAPTVEAKPVVHAHWEEIRQGLHICSSCKVKASLTSDEYDYMEDLSDYCPHCGARMDEVASDTNVGSKTDHIAEVGKKEPFPQAHENGVKIPVISMEDVPKLAKESD